MSCEDAPKPTKSEVFAKALQAKKGEKVAALSPAALTHLTRAGLGAGIGAAAGGASAGPENRASGALKGALVGGALGGGGSVLAGRAAAAKAAIPKSPRPGFSAPAPLSGPIPKAPTMVPGPTIHAPVSGVRPSAAPTAAPQATNGPAVAPTVAPTKPSPGQVAPTAKGTAAPKDPNATPVFDHPPVQAPAAPMRVPNSGASAKSSMPRASADPTFNSVVNNDMAYQGLPQDTRSLIENNAWRSKNNMTPRAMMQMAYQSRNQGEALPDAIRRLVPSLPKVAAAKIANFATSEFSGELGPGGGLPVGALPPFRVEPFKRPKEKTAEFFMAAEMAKLCGVPLSPAARLSVSKRVGAPKVTAPSGPSIADISKPTGFGMKLPGATKSM